MTDIEDVRTVAQLRLDSGAEFVRTPVGSYWGNPTPEQVEEIEQRLSSPKMAAVVRKCAVGDLCGRVVDGFEVHYFDR